MDMRGMAIRSRGGFSLVELLVVMAIIAIVLAVALPIMSRARLGAEETMVVREMHTIGQCQTQYQSQFGRYAAALAELGPPNKGAVEGPQGSGLMAASLASGEKDGYRFVLTAVPGGYTLVATPEVFGKTGRRTFFLDQDGTVHQNWGPELASLDSPEFK
jgi:prepilin-type N-terminal cleavage/methylation domain-containing protein